MYDMDVFLEPLNTNAREVADGARVEHWLVLTMLLE
jgi:hypothetical protein